MIKINLNETEIKNYFYQHCLDSFTIRDLNGENKYISFTFFIDNDWFRVFYYPSTNKYTIDKDNRTIFTVFYSSEFNEYIKKLEAIKFLVENHLKYEP